MWGFDIRVRKRDLLYAALLMYVPVLALGVGIGVAVGAWK